MKETPEALRRRIMRAVKSTNTAPEIFLRRQVHAMGFRYRLHCKDLPGTPDLVFSRLHKVIWVNGCFWHGHECARGARLPKTNVAYWRAKIARNRSRDAASTAAIKLLGWQPLTLWECDLNNEARLKRRLAKFLRSA